MKTIDSFSGEFEFLSNFAPSIVYWPAGGMASEISYRTVEHAYQAAKTLVEGERDKIRNAKTAAAAKKLGRKATLRKDWENIKLTVMLNLLRQKFAIPELRQRLLDTGDAELIEGNWWGDTFWGVCRGKGKNNLGKLLMRIRKEIQ